MTRTFARPRPQALAGRNVLITGGSRGLGLAMAREFAYRGWTVAVCARDKDELERTTAEFASRGETFLTFRCDLTDAAQVAGMVREVEAKLGPIDVLVNNAGVIQVGPLENQTLDDFHAAMQGNFWSAVHTSLSVIPGMRRRGKGRIVNISSIGGKIAVPHLLPYCASKFALTGFSRGMQAELAKDGIRVTTVVPGLMRTGSPRNIDVKGQHEMEFGWFMLADSIPGLSMDVEEAARQVVDACIAGEGEVILGAPAKIAALVEAIAPELTSMLLERTNRLLPQPSSDQSSRKGFESESILTENPLTRPTRKAELRNNQLPTQ